MCMHAHTHVHAKASTHTYTHTHIISFPLYLLRLPSPLSLLFLFELSSPRFDATIIYESHTLFLTYVLRFIKATRRETKDSRGWILNWPLAFTPTAYTCAHVFSMHTSIYTHHYKLPLHFCRAVLAATKLVPPNNYVWTHHTKHVALMNLLPFPSSTGTQSVGVGTQSV